MICLFQDDSVIRIHMDVDELNAEMFIVLHNTGLGYGTDYLVMSFVDTWEEQGGRQVGNIIIIITK